MPLPSLAGRSATVRQVHPSSHCSRTVSTPERASSADHVMRMRPSGSVVSAARATSGGVRSVRTRPRRWDTSVCENGPPFRNFSRTWCVPSARPVSGTCIWSRPGACAD